MASFLNVPNLLTCLRIALTPFIVSAVLGGHCGRALHLSMIAGATDALDGYVARRFGVATRAGAYLDPIADKLLLTLLYIAIGMASLAPVWLVMLIVLRDVVILAMAVAGLLLTGVRDFPPSVWGKLSTMVQIATALMMLAVCAYPLAAASATVQMFVILCAAATVWSGAHYLWRGARVLRGITNK